MDGNVEGLNGWLLAQTWKSLSGRGFHVGYARGHVGYADGSPTKYIHVGYAGGTSGILMGVQIVLFNLMKGHAWDMPNTYLETHMVT